MTGRFVQRKAPQVLKILKTVLSVTTRDYNDHRSYAHNLCSREINLKPEKNSGLNGIRTHDLCDTAAVLYQLSYQSLS